MALESTHIPLPYVAGEDFTAKQYYAVMDTTAPKTVVAQTTAGGFCTGIMQGKPKSGDGCTVAHAGRSKAIAGGAIARGQIVASDATGRVVVAASGNYPIGKAEEAASGAGKVISILVIPSLVPLA